MSVSKGEVFAIIINNTKVAESYINTIHSLILVSNMLKYCNKQGRFPANQNEKID